MTEDVAAPARRKQSAMRTVGKHANRSSTRLSSKMGRAAGAASLAPLTKLNGDGGQDAQAPKFLGDRSRERSTDSLPRVPSASRITAAKGVAAGGKASRKSKSTSEGATRKSVIQLEHEDSEDGSNGSYEDTESETEAAAEEAVEERAVSAEAAAKDEIVAAPRPECDLVPPQRPQMMRRTSSGLSVGISNVAPTPPQLSTETVVSVTSAVDMANALNVMSSKSQFVDEGDFISRAMNRSHSASDLKGIVGANPMRTQQKMLVRQHQSHVLQQTPMPESLEARRGYERAVKEYINARQLMSPVRASLQRTAGHCGARTTPVPSVAGHGGSTGEGSDEQLKIASLSATTVNEMAGLTLTDHDRTPAHHAQHMSNYLLLNLWNEGWTDPEKIDVGAGASSDDIRSQAQKVYQRISAPQWSRRRSSTVKLV